jgi:cytochrome bd ubiquinol oxidase subunit II
MYKPLWDAALSVDRQWAEPYPTKIPYFSGRGITWFSVLKVVVMDLNVLWFGIIIALFVGFFFLEGFDFGVGILLPFIAKKDAERRQVISSIAPFWDGNEVWLVTAAGAMFAAFPVWYATMFSAYYLLLIPLLLTMIVRGVGFEFRNKHEGERWRKAWDWFIFAGSLVPAFLWGVALTNLVRGVPINAEQNFAGSVFDLFNLYALLGGITFLFLFTLHGAIFLSLKTEGIIMHRAFRVARQLSLPTVLFSGLFLALAFLHTDIYANPQTHPEVTALITISALLMAGGLMLFRRSGWAFAMTGIAVLTLILTLFLGLFPRVMVSSLDRQWSLTIYNAASGSYTLSVISWIALGFVPVVVGYQAWNYWVFRHRVRQNAHDYH